MARSNVFKWSGNALNVSHLRGQMRLKSDIHDKCRYFFSFSHISPRLTSLSYWAFGYPIWMQSIWVVVIVIHCHVHWCDMHFPLIICSQQKTFDEPNFNWFSCINAIKSRWYHFSCSKIKTKTTNQQRNSYHVQRIDFIFFLFLSNSNLCNTISLKNCCVINNVL